MTSDRLGPTCGARQVYDLVTAPLASALGFDSPSVTAAKGSRLVASTSDTWCPVLITAAWGEGIESAWRDAVGAGLPATTPWFIAVNGQQVRLVDGRRAFARRYVQFDLDLSFEDERLFSILWLLLSRRSFEPAPLALIDRIVAESDRNMLGVCRSLREGVLSALGELLRAFLERRPQDVSQSVLDSAHQQSLTIIYRVLFLLFAESRLLVPLWHPLYREGYSLDAARAVAEGSGPADGLWETLQAISRLSHAGCQAGDLRVTPFNGRLFSPSATPLGEQAALGDEPVRRMLLALSTTPRKGGRARIVYRDLDVEQLGAVYESLLDYVPVVTSPAAGVELRTGGGIRKSTGTFYTPRALATYLVRRTLAPLVAGASPDQILSLRVVDPAMGSGAFLVAACRYLASAYEAALVESGRAVAGEIDEADRRSFRRAVAQRCLYGADMNPMAVQLARLSMWLATLAPDRPLTFLDHRLVVGDSLVGASMDDPRRQPAPGTRRRPGRNDADLPLFREAAIGTALRAVLPARWAVEQRPDDSIDDVREKERIVSALRGSRSPLATWKAVLDLWCVHASPGSGRRPAPGVFTELAGHLLDGRSSLPPVLARQLAEAHAETAQQLSPLHWSLEFPELFYGPDGAPLGRPGFDAVIGNPPWDMIRADQDGVGAGANARARAVRLLRFSRDSGIYRAQGDGHANSFQLFVERALQLARHGGRVGLVVPWALLGDAGSFALRRLLFDRTSLDPIVGFDNADRIFPIHRGVRFVAMAVTVGGTTGSVSARFGERTASALDRLPTDRDDRQQFPVVFSRAIVERLAGESLAIPDVRDPADLELIDRLARAWPALSSSVGWHAEFGRELNATDDRPHITPGGAGLPVLEGKHIEPFRAAPDASTARIGQAAARRLLDGRRTFERSRLAYRDVSSATNRLTLIAAVVPRGCVTVHTLFCLRSPLQPAVQHFLCGVLNSFVANYFVRFWVGSHVTTAIIGRLPAPVLPAAAPRFRRIAALARTLSHDPAPLSHPAHARLQAEVAGLYGLSHDDVQRVLRSFPLIPGEMRAETMREFDALGSCVGVRRSRR